MGHITRFQESYIPQLTILLWEKKTLQEAAKAFNITNATLRRWIADNEELTKVWKQACEIHITEAMYRRACGYEYNETQLRKITIGRKEVNTATVITTKHCPPDAAAAKLLLQKLNPDVWNDKLDISGQVNICYDSVLLYDMPSKKQLTNEVTNENTDNCIDIEAT